MKSKTEPNSTNHDKIQLTQEETAQLKRGPVAWFARNPVAANLVMVFIVCAGVFSGVNIPRTLVPNFEINWIQVQLTYPGATPDEIEQSMSIKVEEALREVEGLKRILSKSSNSFAVVQVEVEEGYNISQVQTEIRGAVDSIPSFPENAEKPIVSRLPQLRHVSSLEVSGNNLSRSELRELADEIKLELLTDPLIYKVEVYGAVDYEISIEVDEDMLRKYNVSLADIAQTISRSALDVAGGSVRTEGGNILLQTKGRSYTQKDFERIVLLSFNDGTRVHIGDVAKVRDEFVEGNYISRLNGRNSIGVAPQAYNNQDVIDIANAARLYAERKNKTLPKGTQIDVWSDVSFYLQGRIDMMRKNLLLGMFLVFGVLILFMDIKLAFWVMMGIPISFCGAFLLMPMEPFSVTVNLISLFALIMVLGIVVDDAIIIGESAYNMCEKHGHSVNNVIYGTQKIVVPAVFGVLTTIIAFAPTFFVKGPYAPFPREIGFVVLLCLIFSLIESKLILPAHLAQTKPSTAAWLAPLRRLQGFCNHLLRDYVIAKFYQPFLRTCIKNRYTTIGCFIGMFVLAIGVVTGGIVRVVLTDSPPGDFIQARIETFQGTPDRLLVEHMEFMEDMMLEIDEEEKRTSGEGFMQFINLWNSRDQGYVLVELLPQQGRGLSAGEVMRRWREKVGVLAGTKVLAFSNVEGGNDAPAPISLTVTGNDRVVLRQAAVHVLEELKQYRGVFDIRSDIGDESQELRIELTPEAERLGLSISDVGNQIRHAFYGYEVQRIQRGNDEVKVMVRYPKRDRTNVATLEYMPIRTAEGSYVPFSSVARARMLPSAVELVRADGSSAIDISADVDTDIVSSRDVVGHVLTKLQSKMAQEYRVKLKASAGSEAENDLAIYLFIGFLLAMCANYVFIAMPLRSYIQPAIVMAAIPFCAIGALIGHLIMNLPLSMLSLFGVIAASGVVVNDGLILADFINKACAKGKDIVEAVIEAGSQRYRAIMLTSLTTFFGLLPIMLESSSQARFVVPMAISLSFGVLFATMVTLFLLPCMYIATHDLQGLGTRFWRATGLLPRSDT